MKTSKPSIWLAFVLMAACLPHQAKAAEDATSDAPQAVESEATEDAIESRFSAGMETWLYSTDIKQTGSNVLNAGNRLAKIPRLQSLWDSRLNITAEYGPLYVLVQPRFVIEKNTAGSETDPSVRSEVSGVNRSAELTQASVKLKLGDHTVAVGRELMTWGPGNFRSPSNPFYFDAGRTSPLAATPGIDVVRYTYNMRSTRIHVAQVFSTNQITPTIDMSNSQLLKIDYQGDNYLVSGNLVHRNHYADFLGGFAQYSPDDAWMFFGEIGTVRPLSASGLPRIGQVIKRTEDVLAQFGVFQQPPLATSSLVVGGSYTLEGGPVITAEWLHNYGGLTRDQQAQFFRQAELARTVPNGATQLPPPFNQLPGVGSLQGLGQTLSDGLVGVTLTQTPPLLGRDYLWLSMQSNPQNTKQYWRAEWSQSLTDRSGRALLYAEKSFTSKLSGFVALSLTKGGAQSDFGAFIKSTVTFGIKYFVF